MLEVLGLPPAERAVFLQVARNGPAFPHELASTLGQAPDQLNTALANLKRQGRLHFLPDGRVEVALGRVTPHTTLPPQLWAGLLSPQRLYSEQEIAILKTAIPLLQFARVALNTFADHGPQHALRVKTWVTQLGNALGLTATERQFLRAAALFHDIGNIVERQEHHIRSQETVEKLTTLGELPFTKDEAALVGLLCRWHRREYDPARCDEFRGETVRTGLAASILRVADAMDIDSRRSDYDQKFRFALEFFFPEKRQYFTSLEEIYGVRVVCAHEVTLEVLTRGVVQDNIQIQQLHDDLNKTPLHWKVREIPIPAPPTTGTAGPVRSGARALLIFPFDAHSLVMAALSREHLQCAGYTVEGLCYPDTLDSARWLWQEALPEIDTENLEQVVIVGDRPDANLNAQVLDTLARWRRHGTRISVLNRHEGNWQRIPDLREAGVEVTLGTDWAYFWGDALSFAELEWARLAALTTRDPTMASQRISENEQRVMHGLLFVALNAAVRARNVGDTAGWYALAEPLLDRIAADDRAYFAEKADAFVESFATPAAAPEVRGRVLVFDGVAGATPQALYWMMEAAIEQQGMLVDRSIHYHTPYAIATWGTGDQVELLAMNHWRDQEAPPIRLLYPDDTTPPQGTESTITVRLTPSEAMLVVTRLIEACNKNEPSKG